MDSKRQTNGQDAVETYCDVLRRSFIMQYKVNQVRELLDTYKPILEKKEVINLYLAPRLSVCCLQLSVDFHEKKKVLIEFQNGGVIQSTIKTIYNNQVINHIIQVIQTYLNHYQQIVQYIKNLPLTPIESDIDLQQFIKGQESLWETLDLSSLLVLLDKFDSDGLANFVETIIESTRKNKPIDVVRKELLNLNHIHPINDLNQQSNKPDIYTVQTEFVPANNPNGTVQMLLIPGLNKARFLKFSKWVSNHQPPLLLEKINNVLHTQNTPINIETDQLVLEHSKAQLVHLEQLQIQRYKEQQSQTKIPSIEITGVVQIKDLQLEESFKYVTYWIDILFAIIPRVYNPEQSNIKIDTPQTWHKLLQEPHLNMVVYQLGVSIDNCIWKLVLLNDQQLYDLAGDVELKTKQNNTSLKQAIQNLSCTRTLGIIIYSGPQQLKQLNSIQTLINYLDTIHQLLSQ